VVTTFARRPVLQFIEYRAKKVRFKIKTNRSRNWGRNRKV